MAKQGGKGDKKQASVVPIRAPKASEKDAALENASQTIALIKQELADAYQEIGALLLANRRIEKTTRYLAQRLSQYEDVNTGELMLTEDEGAISDD